MTKDKKIYYRPEYFEDGCWCDAGPSFYDCYDIEVVRMVKRSSEKTYKRVRIVRVTEEIVSDE